MLYRLGILSFTAALFCFTFANAQIMCIHTGDQDHVFDLSRVDSITFTNPQIAFEPPVIFFGEVQPGGVQGRNVTITNTGTGVLTIYDIIFDNETFYIEDQPPFGIDAGNQHILRVFFSPPRDGDFASDMIINSNSRVDQAVIISLSGIGFDQFLFEETEISMAILVQEATINGLSLQEHDWIGVYTDEGLCVGSCEVEEGQPIGFFAWGAERNQDNGFQIGEELHFRFWDFSERIVVNVDVIEEVNGVEPIWIENGFIVVRLRASLDER